MRQSILVVDDDFQVLKLFGAILEKGGYSVVLASSGAGIVKVLQEAAVDLVVLDLSMPKPDGFELLKELRALLPALRVVVVSGYLPESLLKAARLLGASATLAKTDAPGMLLQTVSNLLQDSRREMPGR